MLLTPVFFRLFFQHLVTAVRSVAPPPPGVPLGPPQGAPGTPVIKREIVRTTPGVDQMHLQIGNNSNDGTAGSNHSSPNAAAVAAAAAGHNHTVRLSLHQHQIVQKSSRCFW